MLKLIYFAVFGMLLFAYSANAVELKPYGTFNYKWSHDENTSGVAHDKLENNGSIIGVNISEPSIEGSSLNGVAKLEVGLDIDDSGSDTFDSRLAYAGIENNGVAITVGRQAHASVSKTGNFEVYGSNAVFKYGDRSSNSIKLDNGSFSAMAIVDGSTGQDGIDMWEASLSHSMEGIDISVGYADDVVNDISYWGAGASTTVGDLTIASTYTIKDQANDLEGMEATIGWKAFTIGYGDKEGTGTYMTYGVSHSMTDSLSVYAEMQQDDLDTGTDLQHYSVGTKFTF
tara:strand:+ start:1593 stop:2450 length:858 start_codon:yes stop_codon:yes gene_type:complete